MLEKQSENKGKITSSSHTISKIRHIFEEQSLTHFPDNLSIAEILNTDQTAIEAIRSKRIYLSEKPDENSKKILSVFESEIQETRQELYHLLKTLSQNRIQCFNLQEQTESLKTIEIFNLELKRSIAKILFYLNHNTEESIQTEIPNDNFIRMLSDFDEIFKEDEFSLRELHLNIEDKAKFIPNEALVLDTTAIEFSAENIKILSLRQELISKTIKLVKLRYALEKTTTETNTENILLAITEVQAELNLIQLNLKIEIAMAELSEMQINH